MNCLIRYQYIIWLRPSSICYNDSIPPSRSPYNALPSGISNMYSAYHRSSPSSSTPSLGTSGLRSLISIQTHIGSASVLTWDSIRGRGKTI